MIINNFKPQNEAFYKSRNVMRIFIVLLICAFSLNAIASKKAVTENGDVVILSENGSWSYEDENTINKADIFVNPIPFKKDSKSNFVLTSDITDAAFAINPKKWTFKKNPHNSVEFKFKLKNSDLYGMVISEQVEINVEDLVKIAFENAKKAAPDAKIIKKEYRIVNGQKVIYMEMAGTIRSIKFKYLSYYYSNSAGSTQYITYTAQNLVSKYITEIDTFLNGFTIKE